MSEFPLVGTLLVLLGFIFAAAWAVYSIRQKGGHVAGAVPLTEIGRRVVERLRRHDHQAEVRALVFGAAATKAAIESDFMGGRLAGADLLKAIDLLATFQADLRALREESATFMASLVAGLQLELEVAAGVPLSASSAAVVATVKAAIKRLDIKTQRGVEGGTPEGRPTPAQRGQVPCDYCGGDHPVEDCDEVPGWCEWCSGHHDFSECARAQRELGQQEGLTLVKGQPGSGRSGPEVASALKPDKDTPAPTTTSTRGWCANKPLSWHYQRLLANEQEMLNDPEARAFKEQWEKSPEGQEFKRQQAELLEEYKRQQADLRKGATMQEQPASSSMTYMDFSALPEPLQKAAFFLDSFRWCNVLVQDGRGNWSEPRQDGEPPRLEAFRAVLSQAKASGLDPREVYRWAVFLKGKSVAKGHQVPSYESVKPA